MVEACIATVGFVFVFQSTQLLWFRKSHHSQWLGWWPGNMLC